MNIEQNLKCIYQKINLIAKDYKRNPKQISLIAVSKTQSTKIIESAINAGQISFGENYVQEGIKKIKWFDQKQNNKKLIWHFIGTLQSNKSKLIAEHFDWCHTVDRAYLACKLNQYRPMSLTPLNVLIQINININSTRAGINPHELLILAKVISTCSRLKLRGLMIIPIPEKDFYKQLIIFNYITTLFRKLQTYYSNIDTLSMGMTNDMEAAIAAGSTMLRLGTAIFGLRKN